MVLVVTLSPPGPAVPRHPAAWLKSVPRADCSASRAFSFFTSAQKDFMSSRLESWSRELETYPFWIGALTSLPWSLDRLSGRASDPLPSSPVIFTISQEDIVIYPVHISDKYNLVPGKLNYKNQLRIIECQCRPLCTGPGQCTEAPAAPGLLAHCDRRAADAGESGSCLDLPVTRTCLDLPVTRTVTLSRKAAGARPSDGHRFAPCCGCRPGRRAEPVRRRVRRAAAQAGGDAA